MNKGNLKIFKLIFCIVISCVGIYMTFFYPKETQTLSEKKEITQTDGKVNDTGKMENEYDYKSRNLPDTENESSDTYTEKNAVDIYFSNTEKLDNGKLPLAAQAGLAEDAQRYLRQCGYSDVTELYIDASSYQETEAGIRFDCYMDGYQDMLRIEYRFDEKTLFFSIIVKDISETEMIEQE